MRRCSLRYLINVFKRVAILRARLVQITEVDAYSDASNLFWFDDQVGDLHWVFYLLNESYIHYIFQLLFHNTVIL